MCGIAGIISLKEPGVDRLWLKKMNDTLSLRGPDDEGFYFSDHVGLAHRRLSIIDLASGHQPMTTEDGRFSLVFNGEIYNFLEIKEALIKKGISFKTKSDAEVLLRLFAIKGKDCLQEINGMFAFAIWDKLHKSLFLARDRMGKKPLYFARLENHFIFASELKALLAFPLTRKQIEPEALKLFFTHECVPAPFSIIKGVHKLRQAHCLYYANNQIQMDRYWCPPAGGSCEDDFGTAKKKLVSLIDKATEYRLIADVPVGVFLSGGIDSSTVVAMIAKHRAGKDIKTFAINFKEQSYDESPYSALVAKTFGTDHHEETLTADLMRNILPEVCDYLDEPFADGSILPTFLLSRFTRKYVKVALGGDGGDELFAGYPTFVASRVATLYQRLPSFVKKGFLGAAACLPVSNKNMGLDFVARQFLLGVAYDGVLKNQVWLAGVCPEEQSVFFHQDFLRQIQNTDPFFLIREEMLSCPSKDPGSQLSYFYQKFYMCDDILVKVDRASMANSLEVRAPLLDTSVVNYANSLPHSYKLKGLTTKYILKKSVEKMLPKQIVRRPKKGFGIPMTGWLKNELKPIMLQTLNKKTIVADGYFSWPYVDKLIREHLSGHKNNRKQLFSLLMFHWWKERFLDLRPCSL
ncbi:MAG: hypothetical protein ACD_62C00567G0007 [uncultured bacterium]|nr:MAG: hypothetical protein ACD_62C00567G0007 [uncultured bacterium]